jgi:hypothetical protein
LQSAIRPEGGGRAHRTPGPAEHVEQHAVADPCQDADAETAANDQVQRLGWIVAVEDDLALRERPPARDREQLAHAAVTVQRISLQRANARRFSILLRAQIR